MVEDVELAFRSVAEARAAVDRALNRCTVSADRALLMRALMAASHALRAAEFTMSEAANAARELQLRQRPQEHTTVTRSPR